ncbi:uncharacterized protein IL334_007501 [Kwoniella shivajii]|uniref:Cryptic loci regulator 2 N-terminal domain-containing protein n=1 Tax=Kwoniella shivajii TaxID=564305 RepID=A0ABZ1D9B9_9TREE|nr:hypothetical protein IL334_007501 [Kwoniella shivajii]
MPRASTSRTRPPPLRRSLRHTGQSQSQSHSQSRLDSELGDQPSWLNSQTPQSQATQGVENSFLSISTAPLPPKYKITLALGQDIVLSDKEEKEAHVRGEELLSDGWRRHNDPEGDLEDLRKRFKRNAHVQSDQPISNRHSTQLNADVLWYTAGLRFPCVCSLNRLKYAYTPSSLPPITTRLSHLNASVDEANVAREIVDIPEWFSLSDDIDLDPSLDTIESFEITWNIKPPLPSSSQISDTGTAVDNSPNARQIEESRWRKGKFRAIEEPLLPLPPPNGTKLRNGEGNVETLGIILPPSDEMQMDVAKKLNGWEEESKRRKAYWRRLIRDDDGFGKIWNFLPLPYNHSSRYLPKPTKKIKIIPIPKYNLPRTYSTFEHPFHPALLRYISIAPFARVYWLLPIHGPILIPTLNHPMTSNLYPNATIPSSGMLCDTLLATVSTKSAKPIPINWTSTLLLNFIEHYLYPLYMDDNRPFGIISYVFSGPKPDPFIDLPTPPIVQSHAHLPTPINGEEKQREREKYSQDQMHNSCTSKPVRAESGDHLRIYCNAKYALELRTWLHNVKIPAVSISSKSAVQDGLPAINEQETMRIFYKTRLTLVGEKGEVLIVA